MLTGIRARIGLAAATVLVGGTVVLGVGAMASAAPSRAAAPAGGDCFTWQDSNTFGVRCNISSGYNAAAKCNDGSTQYGPNVTTGHWSYAYCSSHGGLDHGWIG